MKKTFALLLSLLFLFSVVVAAQDEEGTEEEKSKLNAGTLSALKWRSVGPALMSGRVIDIAVDPTSWSTWYVALASGNVWKTDNAGTTWTPIFDSYGSYSIGCVTIDPNDHNIVWVGTGENNSQRSVGYGDGIYKSMDGGRSFKNMGLKDSEHIGNILVHPEDSNIVYVAAQGPLWREGGDRGLYMTTDGGENWEKILDIDEHTGINKVYMDPRDPDVLYATSYQRRRHVWVLINGGPGSAIHKSTDGGKTWRKINKGLPSMDMGRIGFDISPQNPDVLYAVVESHPEVEGFFRSEDGGENWNKMSGYVAGSPQYYNEIYCDPHVFDRVYSLDTLLMATDDGGANFYRVGEEHKHVDNHAIAFDPSDVNHLLVGCDGGLYETWDRGKSYKFFANLPVTQFYKVSTDNDLPFYNIYGGTQDNSSQGGPSQTDNRQGIRNSDWFVTVGGDGYETVVDPENPDILYCQWQYGGINRYDRKSGELVDIRPMEEPDQTPNNWNWDSPLMISPHNHERIYFASQRLWRSDDRGDSWTRISPDLHRTEVDRNKLKVMGRVWGVDTVAKNQSTSVYGNIVALTESPLVEGLIYVGTDDGLIQVTEDGGENWTRYDTFPGVPDMSYVNFVEADMHNADTVYAAFNNHKRGDFKPYLLKSTDRGKTWTSINGDLPERGSTYAIKQDHVNPNLLFVGTEFGAFCTIDGGTKWFQLKSGLPTIAVRDIDIQRRENDVVLGTFGRSFYVLDDYSPLRTISEEMLEEEAHIFPIETADLYIMKDHLGGEKGSQGAAYFTAPNPPFGATITYYMKDSYKTIKATRREEEAKIRKEGGDVFYPSWEDLKKEDREESPALIFTVKDSDGNVVRRFTGSPSAGMKRVNWDLRYSPFYLGGGRFSPPGPLVVPGTYSVSMMVYAGGEFKELPGEQSFDVEPLTAYAMEPQDRAESLAFIGEVGTLMRRVIAANSAVGEAADTIDSIKRALLDTPKAGTDLMLEVRALELKLMDLREELSGDLTKGRRSELSDSTPLMERLRYAYEAGISQTYGPTGTQRRQFELATEMFDALQPQLKNFVEVELPALEAKLVALGAPYIPSKKVLEPEVEEER